jgi:hypothetical protein
MIFLAMKKIVSPKYLDASSLKTLKLSDNEQLMSKKVGELKHHEFMRWLNAEA